MKSFKKTLGNALLIFAIFIFLSTMFFTIKSKVKHEDIFLYGYKPFIIQTGSMEPYIKVHSLVVIKKSDFNSVKNNDVISFVLPGTRTYICHRAIEISDSSITTKGDNNKSEDLQKVTPENYIGKVVFKTNFTAYVSGQFKSLTGIIKLIALLIAIILIVIAIKIFSEK